MGRFLFLAVPFPVPNPFHIPFQRSSNHVSKVFHMAISLSEFCKTNDLPKTSVYRKCQALGINAANGLTDDDCDKLKREFGVGAIVLRHGGAIDLPGVNSAPTVAGDLSNLEATQKQAAALAGASAEQLQSFLDGYATHRVMGAIASIDAQVAALEGKALNNALGKLGGGNSAA